MLSCAAATKSADALMYVTLAFSGAVDLLGLCVELPEGSEHVRGSKAVAAGGWVGVDQGFAFFCSTA
jgi:hypothetical protein